MIYQLHHDVAPKTCENFLALCQGDRFNSQNKNLSYQHTEVTKFYKDFYLQGGDVNGNGGESIYGTFFADETKSIKHDHPGVLGMCNLGRRHTNGSQFYITLDKIPEFDIKYLAFGQIIHGMKNFKRLNKLQPRGQHSPYTTMTIVKCGEYEYDKNDFVQDF